MANAVPQSVVNSTSLRVQRFRLQGPDIYLPIICSLKWCIDFTVFVKIWRCLFFTRTLFKLLQKLFHSKCCVIVKHTEKSEKPSAIAFMLTREMTYKNRNSHIEKTMKCDGSSVTAICQYLSSIHT